MMEISPWTIYWIMQMDSILVVFEVSVFVAVLSTMACIFWLIVSAAEGLKKSPAIICLAMSVVALFCFVGLRCFVPSTKTLAAVYAIPAIVNSDAADKVGKDVAELYDLGVTKLREQLTEKEGN